MHPVLLKIGSINIYSYGVMVAIGFALSAFLIYRSAGKANLHKDKVIDLAIIILVFGIVGARALYVALNIQYYMAHPFEALDLSRGGLVWYGGFFSGIISALVYIRMNGLDFWLLMDLVSPYVALAQAFGRIGCFLNGCCYGRDGHPAQIYSMLLLLAIFVILKIWYGLAHFKGEIFLGYLLLYAVKRFFVEFFRGDNPRIFFGLTLSQAVSLAVFFIALAIFLRKRSAWKRYLSSK